MIRKTTLALVALALAPLGALAAGGGLHLLEANTDVEDRASLQRGAKLYVNYCLACHSLAYMRYNRMGRDLGLTDAQVRENLLPPGRKVVDEMTISMRPDDAAEWFGVTPPDLSVIARSRGPDWLYSYLVSFHADPNPARPFGVNNVVFPDVGMPHVLASLQGVQTLTHAEVPEGANVQPSRLEAIGTTLRVYKTLTLADGSHETVADVLEVTTPGELSPGEYRAAMRDLVNFLAYVGEPAQVARTSLGFWVLLFLAVLFVLSRALYKEYWKDVH